MTERRVFRGVLRACIVAAVVAVAAVSCVMDEPLPVVKSGDKIAFSVALDNGFVARSADGATAATKAEVVESAGSASHFLCSLGEDSLYLSVSELRNSVQWALGADTAAVETKGAPIEDPSGSGENKLAEFWVSAKLDDGVDYFIDEKVAVSATSTGRYWPMDRDLNFLAYAPAAAKGNVNLNFSVEEEKGAGSFSYTMPAPLTGDNDGQDAVNLPDYIYSLASGKNKANSGESVALGFHHAFSAICFKVGTMPEKVFVEHIALKNIYSGGECSFVEDATAGVLFTWSGQSSSEKKSYKQIFKRSVNTGEEGALVNNGDDHINSNEQTFMVVPQDFAGNEAAEIEISFSIDGRPYVLSKPIKGISAEWEADRRYVYVISIPEDVDIEIEDEVSGAEKKNLVMTNKGFADSYIRAAVVGYWIVEDGDNSYVVSDWKETDGEFVRGSGWDSYWKLHTDGFYYYKYPLKNGETPTVPLFDTYTLTAESPVVNAQLQLSVMVQSVVATVLGNGSWPWEVNKGDNWFSATPESK